MTSWILKMLTIANMMFLRSPVMERSTIFVVKTCNQMISQQPRPSLFVFTPITQWNERDSLFNIPALNRLRKKQTIYIITITTIFDVHEWLNNKSTRNKCVYSCTYCSCPLPLSSNVPCLNTLLTHSNGYEPFVIIQWSSC